MIIKVALLEDREDYIKLMRINLSLFQKNWKSEKTLLLEDVEFDIDVFINAEEFLQIIAENCVYDLVMIDVVLSGKKTGLDVIEHLNYFYPGISKLAMSAQSLESILKMHQCSNNTVEGIFRNFRCGFYNKTSPKNLLKEKIEFLLLLRLDLKTFDNDRKELLQLNGREKNNRIVKHQLSQYETAFFAYNEMLLEEMKEYVIAHDGDKRMLSYISRVRDIQNEYSIVAKKLHQLLEGSVQFERLNLKDLASNVLESFSAWFKKRKINYVFSNGVKHDNMVIYGSDLLLKQVLMNLIVNSIDSLEFANCAERKIEMKIFQFDNKVHLLLEDNGLGLPIEKKDCIWELGFTTKKNSGSAGGSGIGMNVVREIVYEHKGEIKINCEENKFFQTEMIFPLII